MARVTVSEGISPDGSAACSDSQTMPPFGATSTNHGATTTGRHTDKKAVGAFTANNGRLVGAFHGQTLRYRYEVNAQLDMDSLLFVKH